MENSTRIQAPPKYYLKRGDSKHLYPVPGTGHSTGIAAEALGKDRNRIFRNVSIDLSV